MASEGALCAGSGACTGEPSDGTVGHRHVDWLKTSSLKSLTVAILCFCYPSCLCVSANIKN